MKLWQWERMKEVHPYPRRHAAESFALLHRLSTGSSASPMALPLALPLRQPPPPRCSAEASLSARRVLASQPSRACQQIAASHHRCLKLRWGVVSYLCSSPSPPNLRNSEKLRDLGTPLPAWTPPSCSLDLPACWPSCPRARRSSSCAACAQPHALLAALWQEDEEEKQQKGKEEEEEEDGEEEVLTVSEKTQEEEGEVEEVEGVGVGESEEEEVVEVDTIPWVSPVAAQPKHEGEQGRQQHAMLIDANFFIYRAFYQVRKRLLKHISTCRRDPIPDNEDAYGTVFAFFDFLVPLLDHWRPTHLAVALDHSGPTFRDKKFPEYKKNRKPMEPALEQAMPIVESALHAGAFHPVQVSEVEADDVIATLAEECLREGMQVTIVSSDKDFFQLLRPGIGLLRLDMRARALVPFDDETFRSEYRMEPEQYVDFLALKGDKSDDVPGAKGIGRKRAAKLIQTFGSLDYLLQHVEEIGSPLCRKAMGDPENQRMVKLSRELVQLKKDVQHDEALCNLRVEAPGDQESFLFWDLISKMEEENLHMGTGTRERIVRYWEELKRRRLEGE